jgi:hypothetical protein
MRRPLRGLAGGRSARRTSYANQNQFERHEKAHGEQAQAPLSHSLEDERQRVQHAAHASGVSGNQAIAAHLRRRQHRNGGGRSPQQARPKRRRNAFGRAASAAHKGVKCGSGTKIGPTILVANAAPPRRMHASNVSAFVRARAPSRGAGGAREADAMLVCRQAPSRQRPARAPRVTRARLPDGGRPTHSDARVEARRTAARAHCRLAFFRFPIKYKELRSVGVV